jgi:hypothetical protein
MNCWQFKKCGREAGGSKASELGICPAYEFKAGEACWLIAGTFCGGEVQGSFVEKEGNCMKCAFFKQYDLQHRMKVRQAFASR